jgi:hypothetical protein
MAERSAESIGLTILTIAEVPNFFSGLLPSLFTIGHFSTDESAEAVYWIRRGEVNALGLSLGLGLGASLISKSWMPLVGCVAMSGFLMYHYEHALRHGQGNSIVNQERDDT